MSTIPNRSEDKIRFTPDHQRDREDQWDVPFDDLQADLEVGWGDSFLESFFD